MTRITLTKTCEDELARLIDSFAEFPDMQMEFVIAFESLLGKLQMHPHQCTPFGLDRERGKWVFQASTRRLQTPDGPLQLNLFLYKIMSGGAVSEIRVFWANFWSA